MNTNMHQEKINETELAFQIADRFISIQETDDGYDYSIMDADYKEIDGGVYDNPNISIREALNDIVEDLKENPSNRASGNISDKDELTPIDYDELIAKVEAANHIEPQTHKEKNITVLEKPYTQREMLEKQDEDGYVTGNVAVPLSDIIDNDLEGFLDILGRKLVNNECLMDINYKAIGIKNADIIIEVTGDISEVLDN